MRKNLIFLTVLLLLLGCAWAPADAGAQSGKNESTPPLNTSSYSSVYLPILMTPWLDSTFGVEVSQLDETVAARAKEANSAWVRVNALYWARYQPNNSYEFIVDTSLEQELIKASQSGMKTILIINRLPAWAREYSDSVCGPVHPDMLDEFANFMTMVVQRYSQPPFNVKYYELMNEPDLPLTRNDPNTPRDESDIPYGCWGDLNPAAELFGGGKYAEMLKVVTPAMKSANPTVKVVLGGLLLDCDPSVCDDYRKPMAGYFEGVLKAGGGQYLDVVNFHAYNSCQVDVSPVHQELNFSTWASRGGQVEGKVNFLRQVMSSYNVDKPIILTEAGLLSGSCVSLSEDYELDKAEYVVWLYTHNWSMGLFATTWYTMDKGGWRGTGLLDAQNNPTPAYYAFKTMTDTLHGTRFTAEYHPTDNVTVFEFDNGSKVWTFFSMNGNREYVDLSSLTGSGNLAILEAFDLFGNACNGSGTDYCSLQGSALSFDLPVYVRVRH